MGVRAADTTTASNQYQPQSKDLAGVTVEAMPKQLGAAQEKNIFSVKLNTHSVELDFDFKKIMVLKDDLGNAYRALDWSGGRGGHHLNGEIVFPALNPGASNIKLIIDGIGGVVGTFDWNLK